MSPLESSPQSVFDNDPAFTNFDSTFLNIYCVVHFYGRDIFLSEELGGLEGGTGGQSLSTTWWWLWN